MVGLINDILYVFIVLASLLLINFKSEKWKSFWTVILTLWFIAVIGLVIYL